MNKKHMFYLWGVFVIIILSIYFFFPDLISISNFKNFVAKYYIIAIFIYFIILSLRGLTLIPSTPLLLSGIVLFNPVHLYIINMLGILTSSTLVYFFAHYLGFDSYFEKKYGKWMKIINKKLQNKEFPVIVGWSFFPLVPTDLIIYIGSTLRIRLWKCLLGVFIGEAVLNAFYVFSVSIFI